MRQNTTAPKGAKTHGGIHLEKAFDPALLLDRVNSLVDTSKDKNSIPDIDKLLPGPVRYFFEPGQADNQKDNESVEELCDKLSELAKASGTIILRPTLTVIVYAPNTFLTPHTDGDEQIGNSSALASLSGQGYFDTFRGGNTEFYENISKNIYPDTSTAESETLINAGDLFISYGNVMHGFRNGNSRRVVAGLIETIPN